jgi:aminobenzoyl-glutamate utilization protein B
VSQLTPTVSLIVATAGIDLPWHSWATAASHGLPGAARGALVAAEVLAATGMDLMTDPALLARAQAAFEESTAPYRSPLPPGQKPPLPDVPR